MTGAFKEEYLQCIKCVILTICRMGFMKLLSHVQQNEMLLAETCIGRNSDKPCGSFLKSTCLDGVVWQLCTCHFTWDIMLTPLFLQ